MSEIGKMNLDLQEQANELGFSTVQEALDNGYTCIFSIDGEFRLVDKAERAHEEAHKAWLAERETVLSELRMIMGAGADTPKDAMRKAAQDAIEFIERGEI